MIFDKKTIIDNFSNQPPATLDVYKQWVAIKVPTCGFEDGVDHRFLVEGPFTFVVEHIGGGIVRHRLAQEP